MDELLARLRQVIANYKAFMATRASNSTTPPKNNRHAVVAYYASRFCVLVNKFCEQNNEFARGKVTAEQRNATQRALQTQITTLLAESDPAFGDVLSYEASIAAEKELPAPQTQVRFRDKPYESPEQLLAAMRAEAAALLVGGACNCTLCYANQIAPPVTMSIGSVIPINVSFLGVIPGKAFYDQSVAAISAAPVNIAPEDLANYNTNISNISRFLAATPAATIDIGIGTTGASSDSDPNIVAKLQALLTSRANKVRTDFVAAGIAATRINIIILPLGQPNLAITITIK